MIKFYLKKNNLRQSRYLAKKALDNNHNSIKIIELNAIISMFIGNTIEAIRHYKEIIDIQENQSWRIWKSLLKCILEIEEWSELLRLSLRAKKYFPNKSFLDFTISGCLLKRWKIKRGYIFLSKWK